MLDEPENVEVLLTNLNGEVFTSFSVEPAGTVTKVKQLVQAKLGYPLHSQQLLLRGTILEDGSLLDASSPPLTLMLVLSQFGKPQALLHASVLGHEEAVRNLCVRTARDPQERCSMLLAKDEDVTPLQLALHSGHSLVCRVLLEAAESVGVFNDILRTAGGSFGETALECAAIYGYGAVCHALVEGAPNAEVRNQMLTMRDQGGRALIYAAARGHESVCRVLLQLAAELQVCHAILSARDHNGGTALHQAALRNDEPVCRLLLEAAPTPEARSAMLAAADHEGRTALQVVGGNCRPRPAFASYGV